MMEQPDNEYEQERKQKRQALRDLGVDPYGRRAEHIRPLAEVKSLYRPEMGHDGGPVVKIAGRVMLKRDMGKLSFLTLRDESGDLQVGLDKKRLGERDWQVRDLVDLGDLIIVEGALGITRKGEVTVWGNGIDMGAKALLPPPAKWEGLSDVELRYRQRYVDLWANPQVLRTLKLRMRIVEEIRRYMAGRGFLEVETPMMQAIAGGAAAKPFVTHHNALDIPLYLRIAPELYLKRLLVGGMSRVFELNRNFRNEGISPRHNPEFTMLEAYEAFGSWETMADLVESMICHVAQTVLGTLKIEHRNAEGQVTKTIDLTPPWKRISIVDLVEQERGWRFDGRPLNVANPVLLDTLLGHQWKGVRQLLNSGELAPIDEDGSAARRNLEKGVGAAYYNRVVHQQSPFEQLVEVYEKLIEPKLIDPCFVTHLPSVLIPLAKESPDRPGFAEVYELAINGQEISPGYSELNDPDVQLKHFLNQVGEDRQKMDEDFITALKYGMPPAGGMGLGVDRLVMLLTGAESIRDVLLFPLMKPTEG